MDDEAEHNMLQAIYKAMFSQRGFVIDLTTKSGQEYVRGFLADLDRQGYKISAK